MRSSGFPVLLTLFFTCIMYGVSGQSILGTWQLVKQTSCLEDEMGEESDTMQPLVEQMNAMSSASPKTVTFKEKNSGEESTRILYRKRTANNKKFMYKFNGETLMILDKKSQTLIEAFTVDKFEGDSLIVSSSSRPCETRVFVKIKDAR